jgi:hypothetical protein
VTTLQPPFALASIHFPFPALAGLAGRLPLGGGREVALAVLTTARLATVLLPPESLPAEERQARAAAARVWLASLALPAPLRVPLARAIDASATGAAPAAAALRALSAAATAYLDGGAALELDRLVRRLAAVAS